MLNLKLIIIATLAIELMTVFGRFVLKIQSKAILIKIMKACKLKYMPHIHHFVFGIILVAVSFVFSGLKSYYLLNLGLAVFFSDFVHHFLVLNFTMGHPEFHLIYKNRKFYRLEHEMKVKAKKILKHLVHFS